MKKKIYMTALAVCFVLTAAACGSNSTDTKNTAVTKEEQTSQDEEGNKGVETGTGRLVTVENVEKYITIGEYKGLVLDNKVSVITDADVQAQIETNLQNAAKQVSDVIQEGDLVTINYVGTIDGKTIDGGIANNYDLIVGEGHMADGFEAGLLGMKKGDTKDIVISYPEDYTDETLAGSDVTYKVTVQTVRRKSELTDEWVAENTDDTTVDEYKETVRKQLEEDAQNSAAEVLKNTAWSTVLENSEVKEYPEEDISRAEEEFRTNMEFYAKQADMELDEFVESQGISQEDFNKQCEQYAQGKVKQNLIIQGIMDAEGLSLDDRESLEVQNDLVKQMGVADIAELVGTYGQTYVDEAVGLLRVEDFIVQNANVSEMASTGDTTAPDAEASVNSSQATPQEDMGVDTELEEQLGEEETDTINEAESE